jgi:C-terminal processing protease CtpA/Prc
MTKLNAQTLQRPYKTFNKKSIWLALFTITLFASACQKELDETDPTPTPVTGNKTANDWIMENMQIYYFWNDQLPASPDKSQSAKDFFKSLLYKFDAAARPDGDRFSFMSEDAGELEAALSGQEKTSGAEYTFYLVSEGSNDVIAQVIYVLPGSPADQAGIKRGDIVYQVNGRTLNRSNFYSLLFGQNAQILGIGTWQNNQLVKGNLTKSLNVDIVQENPVYLDSIYTVGAKKIGYVVYNQFIPSPSGTQTGLYDKQLDQIFGNFQSEGINELILDLRYNPGGYVSSATNLASLIGKNIGANKVFYTQEWNSVLMPELEKEYGVDFATEEFVTKSQNIGNQLSRVYILTTGQTASASELIINGLRPYMDVITVGSTSVGKNVGSITITDDTEQFKLALQPIVFKSYNSLGQSDYTAGFTANVEANETIDLKPLGDIEETMLNTALSHITGARTARLSASEPTLPVAGSSLQRKAGGRNMFDNRVLSLPVQVQ